MDWKEWIGKIVFIKLIDGSVFSHSLVNDYANDFISITDKFDSPVQINVSQISKITEDYR